MLGLLSSRAAAIDARAHQAATSPHNDCPSPTRAQQDAGNYRHGHVQVQGLRIAIENPAGSVRSGVDAAGRVWRTLMQHHYGRIKGTEGADGDEVDVFLGPHPESELVFVVDQVIDGRFDEHKVVVGARNEAEARAIYQANYLAGWKGLGAITALPMGEFKEWLANHDTRAPMAGNRLPAALLFVKGRLDPQGRIIAKANDVQRPGIRGGHFYVDQQGHIRYGTPPAGEHPFTGVTSQGVSAAVTKKKSGLFAGRRITGHADTAEIFREITDHDRERFWMVHMDAKAKPLAVECISQGSLSASIVHPREVFKNALALGTKRVALVHNHPSGSQVPSREDRDITDRLRTVAGMVGIGIDHHLVVAADGYTDVESGNAFWWHAPSAGPKRQLREVEGRIQREEPDVPWAYLFGTSVRDPAQAAAIGRTLFDPGERIATVLTLDQKHKLIGVYPVAHDTYDRDFPERIARIAAGTNAAAMVLAASADGPTWEHATQNVVHQTAEAIAHQVGVRFLDTVSVDARSFRSVS